MSGLSPNELIEHVREGQDRVDINILSPYSEERAQGHNDFLIFIKPAVVGAMVGGNLGAWAVIEQKLLEFRVELAAVAILSGRALAASGIVRQHYGVINVVSERGEATFNDEAKRAIATVDPDHDIKIILGAHQFLNRYPEVTPERLAERFGRSSVKRLTHGTYGAVLNQAGERVLVLNGFHPAQIQEFERKDASIVLLQGISDTVWRDLRAEMVGATDPKKAQHGSIRRLLAQHAEQLSLGQVSALRNGIHMSAGPLEGAVENARFLFGSLNLPNLLRTSFGSAAAAIIGPLTMRLGRNEQVKLNGEILSAFDATEDMDAAHALELLTTGALEVDVVPA